MKYNLFFVFILLWHILKKMLNFIYNVKSFIVGSDDVITFQKSGLKIKIEKLIAEGGFSYVYLGVDENRKKFALKKINICNSEIKNSTEREIKAMRKFKSPYILDIVDTKKVPHDTYVNFYFHYLLMPYVDQGSLVDVIERYKMIGRSLEEKQIFEIFVKICLAVKVLHSSKVPMAHRDLKLGNVLIDSLNNPLLTDFGSVSKARKSIKSRQEAVALKEWAESHCTNSYRPPELFDCPSEFEIDERTDIWSLGCVLYGMAFGSSPFEDITGETSIALAVINGTYDCPAESRYSEKFFGLVKLMLSHDIKKRPFIDEVIQRVNVLIE